MAQDLRELFNKDEGQEKFNMNEGHEKRFMDLLDEEMPLKKKSNWQFYKIAASILILISIGMFYFLNVKEDKIKTTVVDVDSVEETNANISLGDLSPDLKKVENYYVANINLTLSKLEVSDEHKELIDSYMDRLTELNQEYERLNVELNEFGPNDQTISALIKNLQLRLQLLQKLKEKLNKVQSSKNEQYDTNAI